MATPYSAVSGGTKDSYNFYHSQLLRIQIEHAHTIGMLMHHQWVILRSTILADECNKTEDCCAGIYTCQAPQLLKVTVGMFHTLQAMTGSQKEMVVPWFQ